MYTLQRRWQLIPDAQPKEAGGPAVLLPEPLLPEDAPGRGLGHP